MHKITLCVYEEILLSYLDHFIPKITSHRGMGSPKFSTGVLKTALIELMHFIKCTYRPVIVADMRKPVTEHDDSMVFT